MPTQGIDFAKLSLRDALDLAILVEEEARDRYLELAEQMRQFRTRDAAELFDKMARREEMHRGELLRRRRAEAFGEEPSAMSSSMLYDVEAPEYDEARAFMTRRAALLVALKAETKAYEFFSFLVDRVQDEASRQLFAELAREERRHQALVRAELDRQPAGNQVEDDEADDPVAL